VIDSGARTWAQRTHDALRTAGLRIGGPRETVIKLIARHGCLLSAQQIAQRLTLDGHTVSVPTIYRTLHTLHGLGLLVRIDAGDGSWRYERCDPQGTPHHHSVCDRCGTVNAFADPAVEAAIQHAASQLPFTAERHDLVLHGSCEQCAITR
jgi:Fur family transcriptional regulator, ferric uptake regulator